MQSGPTWEILQTSRKHIIVRDAHAEQQSFGSAHTIYEVETKVWTELVCAHMYIHTSVCT